MQTQTHKDEFKNEPFTDFSVEENRAAFEAAIAKVESELGVECPVVIGGEKIKFESTFESRNPANRNEVIGTIADADSDAENLVERALDTATAKFEEWRKTTPQERADYLFRAADIIRERKIVIITGHVYGKR